MVFRRLSEAGYFCTAPDAKLPFMQGNIIPDLSPHKEQTHFRVLCPAGYLVPDLEQAWDTVQPLISDADRTTRFIRLGIYTHLFLDQRFISQTLAREFVYDKGEGIVTQPRTGRIWVADDFFRPAEAGNDGLYRGYSELNSVLIKHGWIHTSDLAEISETLPKTGIAMYDDHRERNWRHDLGFYLGDLSDYTGSYFVSETVIADLVRFATELIESLGEVV